MSQVVKMYATSVFGLLGYIYCKIKECANVHMCIHVQNVQPSVYIKINIELLYIHAHRNKILVCKHICMDLYKFKYNTCLHFFFDRKK